MFGPEKYLCPKDLGSEKVWVRIVFFFLGPKGLGSETPDIPNGDRTDGWTDRLTDVWLAGTFKQIHVIALCRAR